MVKPNVVRPLLALCMIGSPLLYAAEGGVGRPITGQQVFSNAGIVPPEPGWVTSLTSIWYDGEIKGSGGAPISGEVSAGIKMKVSYTMANLTHVWDTGKGRWNYASAVGIPVQYTDIKASITGPRGRTLGDSDSGTQFADALITPIAAGYHFDELNHISLSLPIYVPTGAYNDDRLANPGQNNYTFMPTVAFSHLDGKGGEFTLSGNLQFYTENKATDYRTGDIFTLDLIDKALDYAWHMALPIGAMVIGGFTTLTFRTTPQVFVTIANGRKVELRLKGTSSVVEKRLARASIGEFKSYLLKYFQAPPTPPDAPATKTAQRG